MAKCEAAAIASKEYFDKSRAVMEGYGKELRDDTWWLAIMSSGCTVAFALLLYIIIGWIKN